MARYKSYNYSQTVMLPVSLEDQLMPGTIEFAIHTLVEHRVDVSRFDERHQNDETGRTAYDPKVLLKLVLLAYARGIFASRKIEQACRENVVFMALTCGQQPDHSTISPFVSSMKEEILPLFGDVLLVCEEMNLLGGTEFSLDGLRLSSNASKELSGTKAELKAKQEKLEARVKEMLDKHMEEDQREEEDKNRSGKNKRQSAIANLEGKAKRIKEFLKENKPKEGKQFKEVKSNVTDNESAMMYTPHGVIQGYNAQALVDGKHQVIVYGEAFGRGQDYRHVEPVLDGAKETLKGIGKEEKCFAGAILTADTAYHSTESIKKCEEEEIDAYIPDKEYRKRDPRFVSSFHKRSRRKKFSLEDFRYDEARGEYECPRGKRLKLQTKSCKTRWGALYWRYYADARDCEGCQLKEKCKSKGRGAQKPRGKILMVPMGSVGRNYSKEMAAKIDTEEGRRIYSRRNAIVEPVFANIRFNKKLDRFNLRGKVKVTIQWLLYCMVHNIEKIVNFGYATG